MPVLIKVWGEGGEVNAVKDGIVQVSCTKGHVDFLWYGNSVSLLPFRIVV